jgi:hypothetical protein
MSLSLPAIQELREIITEELTLVGGTVLDTWEDEERLFLRSLLPMADEVQPKDVIQGGIAVMADEISIHVHPYLLRQVCRNGAIMPQLIQDRSIQRAGLAATSDEIAAVESELRDGVRACSAPEVFSDGVKHFSLAILKVADMAVLEFIRHPSAFQKTQRGLGREIRRRFSQNSDRSMFGLVNAVTSVARDQESPEVRWKLEELGGGMLAMRLPWTRPGNSAVRTREKVEVCL